ncbi:glycosyltransferase family 2 protein [Aspergillus unguis]
MASHGTPKHSKFHTTSRLYAVLNWNYILCPLTLLPVYYCLRRLAGITYWVVVPPDNSRDWTTAAHLAITVLCLVSQFPPYAVLLGMCLPLRPFSNKQGPKWRKFRSLRVCLVTKGTNFEVPYPFSGSFRVMLSVQTVIHSASHWNSISHPKVEFHVVADGESGPRFEGALPSYVHIDNVPNSFQSKKAKYKARALEYFRQTQALTKDDWVLHLDEESEADAYAIQSCLDFIERGTGDVAIGTIFYNGANHWSNALLSAAEAMRIADAFGRFQLPVRLFQRPLLGWMHGSWNLINGAVENNVTWDTDCIAEDFWFAYEAAALGHKFGWLHAVVREQPPCTIQDFFRQRRRWYTGILSIESFIVKFMVSMSIASAAVGLILPVYGLFGYPVPVPNWYFHWVLFNDAVHVHGLVAASVMQDMTMTEIQWVDVALNALKTVLLSPVIHIMQAAALVSSWVQPSRGFKIIEKI